MAQEENASADIRPCHCYGVFGEAVSSDSLHAIVNYVHHNPVKRGLVNRAEDWRWSSARDWMLNSDSPLGVDRTIPSTLDVPWTDRRADRGI